MTGGGSRWLVAGWWYLLVVVGACWWLVVGSCPCSWRWLAVVLRWFARDWLWFAVVSSAWRVDNGCLVVVGDGRRW